MNIEVRGVAAVCGGHLKLVCQGFVSEVWLTWRVGARVCMNPEMLSVLLCIYIGGFVIRA